VVEGGGAERIYVDEFWRVAHAFDSSLAGWLIVVPRRHVEAIAELTPAEAASLGTVLHRASIALTNTLRCQKTYVMQFAEAEGFSHVHFHVVPRMADLPEEHRGPRIFHYLGQSPALSLAARNQLAERLAEVFRAQ
jgi:diadenosine tetraphosphate (Ap4A) HIT family hydrolase